MTCPVCKKKVKLPVAEVEGLPNNIHAIQMVKVDEARGNKGSLGRQFVMQAVAQVTKRYQLFLVRVISYIWLGQHLKTKKVKSKVKQLNMRN